MKVKYLLIAALAAFSVTACKSEPEDEAETNEMVLDEPASNPIINEWVLEDYDFSALKEQVPDQDNAKLDEMQKELLDSQKGKFTLDIQENGKLIMDSPNMDPKKESKHSEGTWSLNADKSSLTTVVDGKTEVFQVLELSSDKMVLEVPSEHISMTLIPK